MWFFNLNSPFVRVAFRMLLNRGAGGQRARGKRNWSSELKIKGAFHSTKMSGLNFRQLPVANGTAFSKIFKKDDNLTRYTQIFETFFPGIFFPFNFAPRISRIFCWMVRISEIQQFPDFLETFPENCCTICRCFQIFESFGWMEQSYWQG